MHFQQFLGVVTYFRIGVAKVLPKIAGNHHYVFPAIFGSSTLDLIYGLVPDLHC